MMIEKNLNYFRLMFFIVGQKNIFFLNMFSFEGYAVKLLLCLQHSPFMFCSIGSCSCLTLKSNVIIVIDLLVVVFIAQ
jgi:hypothetical protein